MSELVLLSSHSISLLSQPHILHFLFEHELQREEMTAPSSIIELQMTKFLNC